MVDQFTIMTSTEPFIREFGQAALQRPEYVPQI